MLFTEKWPIYDVLMSPPTPRDPPLFTFLRAHTRTHHHPKCVGPWRNQSQNKHQTPLTSRTFCQSTSAVNYSALAVALLYVCAPADPYQHLHLLNSLHIQQTLTYSSWKMQMSFFVLKSAPCTFGHGDGHLSTFGWSACWFLFSSQAFLSFSFLNDFIS